MVKISFQPITGQKAEKEEGDGDKTQIFIPHPHVSFAFCVHHPKCHGKQRFKVTKSRKRKDHPS